MDKIGSSIQRVNDPLVRANSFHTQEVEYSKHVSWFNEKLQSPDCKFYLFSDLKNKPAGQVRIDKGKAETLIGISVDADFRGQSAGSEMLMTATRHYLSHHPGAIIRAYIKNENTASLNIFAKAGFSERVQVTVEGDDCYRLSKRGEKE